MPFSQRNHSTLNFEKKLKLTSVCEGVIWGWFAI